MFDSVKLLTNVVSVNLFTTADTLKIYEGSYPVAFTLRLWQSDRNERYIPNVTATVKVEFMRSDTVGETNTDQTVTKYLSRTYATTDTSIWGASLSQSEVAKIVTGGLRVTIVEGSGASQVTTVVYAKMVIAKSPNSDDALCV